MEPELLRAMVDCGIEHFSEEQHKCIPQAILGTDVLSREKSGIGKTAVLALASLSKAMCRRKRCGAWWSATRKSWRTK